MMQHGLLLSSELWSYMILSFNMFSYLFSSCYKMYLLNWKYLVIDSVPQLQNGVFRVLWSFWMNPDHLRLMTYRLWVMADHFKLTVDRNSVGHSRLPLVHNPVWFQF